MAPSSATTVLNRGGQAACSPLDTWGDGTRRLRRRVTRQSTGPKAQRAVRPTLAAVGRNVFVCAGCKDCPLGLRPAQATTSSALKPRAAEDVADGGSLGTLVVPREVTGTPLHWGG